MNVLYLNFGEKQQVPVAFNILSFRKFCEHYGVEFEEMGEVLESKSLLGLTDIIYFGHLAYCSLNGRTPEISHDESTMFAEAADEQVMTRVQEAIYNAKIMGKTLREMREQNENAAENAPEKKIQNPEND